MADDGQEVLSSRVLNGFWRQRDNPCRLVDELIDGRKVVFVMDEQDHQKLVAIDIFNQENRLMGYVTRYPEGNLASGLWSIAPSEFRHLVQIVVEQILAPEIDINTESSYLRDYLWDKNALAENRNLAIQAEDLLKVLPRSDDI